MAELTLHHREWVFSVELEAGDVPDQRKQYTSTFFRPTSFYFTVSAHDGEKPSLYQATIAGPRVLKSGLGATTSQLYCGSSVDLFPVWARAYIDHAIQEIERGDN